MPELQRGGAVLPSIGKDVRPASGAGDEGVVTSPQRCRRRRDAVLILTLARAARFEPMTCGRNCLCCRSAGMPKLETSLGRSQRNCLADPPKAHRQRVRRLAGSALSSRCSYAQCDVGWLARGDASDTIKHTALITKGRIAGVAIPDAISPASSKRRRLMRVWKVNHKSQVLMARGGP